MLKADTAWDLLSIAASALTLGAGVGIVLALVSLWRLRRDARTIMAAESFAATDLTTVIKRHVPTEHQTNVARDEIAFAKQAIAARRPRLKWTALVFGLVLVCGAVTTTELSAPRRLQMIATTWLTAQPQPNLNALRDIQGVWGWRADFLESCSENPHTIQVAPDKKSLTMRYTKPYRHSSVTVTELTFNVVSAEPKKLVLLRTDAAAFTTGKPTPMDVVFIDANTMSWSPSNSLVSSGIIERCASAR